MSAASKKADARTRLALANSGKSMFGEKISNKNRLKLARTGAKNLVAATIESNKAKADKAHGIKRNK